MLNDAPAIKRRSRQGKPAGSTSSQKPAVNVIDRYLTHAMT
jgi:hypothetical protein